MKVQNYREIEATPSPAEPGVGVRWVITEDDGAPGFSMRVVEVQPERATPFHSHNWEHEVFIVSGTGAVRGADGEERALGEGDVIYVRPNEEHTFINRGADPFSFVCMIPIIK